MRTIKIFAAVICLALTATLLTAFIGKTNTTSPAGSNKGFAVIELFTSEGCSSCPPADALVARVQKESTDKPIYILAFHVDYWDRYGWKDIFSSADYTARQRQYARWLKLSSVYTPQAIVNGHTELVGSEESKLRNAIKAGLQNPPKTELALSDVKINNGKIVLQYHAKGATNNASLLIALIEKNATTKVERGENGGKTLSHVQIVRKLESVALGNHNNGQATTALPNGFSTDGWELIGFVQNKSSGVITGAAKAGFPTAVSK